MTYRRIVTPVFGTEGDRTPLQAAAGLARQFGGRINVLFAVPDPRSRIPLVGEGVSASVIEQIIDAANRDLGERREAIGAAVETARANHPDLSIEFTEMSGYCDRVLLDEGRFADLVVMAIPRDGRTDEHQGDLEQVLLHGATPLLLVPPGSTAKPMKRVAVAYNGSLPAHRAVQAAWPMLTAADSVDVLTLSTEKTSAELGRRLANYLQEHGAPARAVALDRDGRAVGATLLANARDLGADVMVLGGYGRSRLQELILGGVTRHVFRETAIPLLMAH